MRPYAVVWLLRLLVKIKKPRSWRGLFGKAHPWTAGTQTRESSDKPILNAFCRVAPSERFSVLAIRAACVFFRASVFNVRTFSGVHARRFVAFLAIQQTPDLDKGDLVARRTNKNNA
jgi:hypothetical protein